MNEIVPGSGLESAAQPSAEEACGGGGKGERLSRRTYVAAAVLIIALAALLRFLFIARYEIWLDEAYCYGVASGSVREIIRDLRLDNGPPLYYLMLSGWMRVFGQTPTALRSLSALFSTATVALLAFWNVPWLSRRARLLSAFILAITPLSLYYAQEARMYSPVVFFAAAAALFLEKALRSGRRVDYVLVGAFTALALYTSYIAIFLVPVGYIALAVGWKGLGRRLALRRLAGLVAAHAAAAIVFLPWLPIFLEQPRAEATQWIARLPGAKLTAQLPFRSLSVMTVGGGYYPSYLRHLRMDPALAERAKEYTKNNPGVAPVLAVLSRIPTIPIPWPLRTKIPLPLAVMVIVTVHMFWKALARKPEGFPARTFLAAYVLLPIAAPLFLSLVRPMYVVGRYEVIGLPGFALLGGIGLEALGKRTRIVWLVLAALLASYSWGYAQFFDEPLKQAERARYLKSIYAPGDIVIAEAFEYAPLLYYSRLVGFRPETVTFPRETQAHSAWIDHDKWLDDIDGWRLPSAALTEEAESTVREALERSASSAAVIVVRNKSEGLYWADAMDAALKEAFPEVARNELAVDEALTNTALRIVVLRKVR